MQVSPSPDLPEFAVIDGQRFRQCLSKILSNAIRYTDSGTIRITVTTHKPNWLRMGITDTGPGVPSALAARIFEPFHRGGSMIAGMGLGLSISRTRARCMREI